MSCRDGVECFDFLFLQDGEADMQSCSAALEWEYFYKKICVDSHKFHKTEQIVWL